MHFADLCHCFKKKDIAIRISQLVTTEFTNQANQESILGIEVTKYFLNLEKYEFFLLSEYQFISGIALPLKNTLKRLLGVIYDKDEIMTLIDNQVEDYIKFIIQEKETHCIKE